MKDRIVSAEEFIKTWQTAKTTGEVMKKLGYENAHSVCMRASWYRRKGVPLKKFVGVKGVEMLDYKALAKLAKEYA